MRPNSGTVTRTFPVQWQTLVPWIALIALLLATRPFRGIYHDAHLYAVQALKRIGYTALEQDIFFAYGNQDDFSAFTTVYGPLIRMLGLSQANALVYVLGLAFWFAALVVLVRVLFDDPRSRLLALAGALMLTPGYGNGMLSYGEGFVTPRIFAEAFGLLGIAAILRHRLITGAVAVVPALILHPLMGLVLLAVIVWLLVESIRAYLGICALGLLAIAGLGWIGIAPFGWFWQIMDQQWFDLAMQNSIAFVTGWGVPGWATLPPKLAILFGIIVFDSGIRARLARAVLIVGLVLMVFSVFWADLLANRLFAALQLWRVLFLVALLANVMAARAVALMPRGRGRTLFILALLVNAAELAFGLTTVLSAVSVLLAAAVLGAEKWLGRPAGLFLRVVSSLIAIFLLLSLIATILTRMTGQSDVIHQLRYLFLPAVFVCAWYIFRSRHVSPLAAGLAIAMLIASVALIDTRSKWTRYAESPAPLPSEVQSAILGKTVYWKDGIQLLWFKQRMPQFYSCRQKSGTVFFRDQALEILRRGEGLSRLGSLDFPADPESYCPTESDEYAIKPGGRAVFEETCRTLPELDLMVLRARVPGLYRQVWLAPVTTAVPVAGQADRKARIPHFFYHCADFRP